MEMSMQMQQEPKTQGWQADDKYIMHEGVQIGSFVTAELAASAVRAVNSHDALVAALRFHQDALHDLCSDVPLMMSLPPSLHARIANMRDDVDAALAAAQE